MNFIDICWLIVKILGGVTLLFLALGFIAKGIKAKRDKQIAVPHNHHKLSWEDFEEDN